MIIKNVSGGSLTIENGYGQQTVADGDLVTIAPEYFWGLGGVNSPDWEIATATDIQNA